MLQKRLITFGFVAMDWFMATISWAVFYYFRKVIIENEQFSVDANFYIGLLLIPFFWLFLFSVGENLHTHTHTHTHALTHTYTPGWTQFLFLYFCLSRSHSLDLFILINTLSPPSPNLSCARSLSPSLPPSHLAVKRSFRKIAMMVYEYHILRLLAMNPLLVVLINRPCTLHSQSLFPPAGDCTPHCRRVLDNNPHGVTTTGPAALA